MKVESGLVRTEDYAAARRSLLECKGVPVKRETIAEADALAARITGEILKQKQPIGSRLVRLHQYYWLRLWLETGAKGALGSVPRGPEDVLDYVFTVGGVS